jgi:8-oxo-dGTP pyrophosphatase MutT (NUDIX family)
VARWQTTSTRTVYENDWIRVREDQVVGPNGRPGIYGVVEVPNPSVFIVALTESDEVVLLTVDRYTTGPSVEIPAGGSDGEDPLVAAQRELLEETGFSAMTWAKIGNMHALNGICEAFEVVYLATGLTRENAGDGRDVEGISGIRTMPFSDVLDLVRDGTIDDGETVAALMFAAIHLGRVG